MNKEEIDKKIEEIDAAIIMRKKQLRDTPGLNEEQIKFLNGKISQLNIEKERLLELNIKPIEKEKVEKIEKVKKNKINKNIEINEPEEDIEKLIENSKEKISFKNTFQSFN